MPFGTPVSPFAELSQNLSSLSNFIEAVNNLRTEIIANPVDVVAHPNTIITLVEVARKTLESNGIKLHVFSSCHPSLRLHKIVYFELLRDLEARVLPHIWGRDDLRKRLNHLVFPLSSKFVIDAAAEMPIRQSKYTQKISPFHATPGAVHPPPRSHSEGTPSLIHSSLLIESYEQSNSQEYRSERAMLPPSTLPPKLSRSNTLEHIPRTARPRATRSFSASPASSTRTGRIDRSAVGQVEAGASNLGSQVLHQYRPRRRAFGIMFTNKQRPQFSQSSQIRPESDPGTISDNDD